MDNIKYIDKHFFYLSELLPKDDITIVEIGSFSGKNAITLYEQLQNPKIIIYEASKTSFEKLKYSVDDYPFIIHNKALVDKNGKIIFHEFEGAPSSASIYSRPSTQKKRKLIKKDFVECVDLQTVFDENKIEKIDLFLLNCEGSEISIMRELINKKSLRDKISQICISFHYGRIYPKHESDELINSLSNSYKTLSNNNNKLEYILFYHD